MDEKEEKNKKSEKWKCWLHATSSKTGSNWTAQMSLFPLSLIVVLSHIDSACAVNRQQILLYTIPALVRVTRRSVEGKAQRTADSWQAGSNANLRFSVVLLLPRTWAKTFFFIFPTTHYYFPSLFSSFPTSFNILVVLFSGWPRFTFTQLKSLKIEFSPTFPSSSFSRFRHFSDCQGEIDDVARPTRKARPK